MPNKNTTTWQWIAVAILAALGVLSLLVGTLQRTVWMPEDTLTVVGTPTSPHSAIAISPGVLAAKDEQATIKTFAPDNKKVAFLYGREADVLAWFEGAPLAVVSDFSTTEKDRFSMTENTSGQTPTDLPNPMESDQFVQKWEGQGSVEITSPKALPGRWMLVAVTDGTAPGPTSVSVTWPVVVDPMTGIPLLALGSIMLSSALTFVFLMRRRNNHSNRDAGRDMWTPTPTPPHTPSPHAPAPGAPAPGPAPAGPAVNLPGPSPTNNIAPQPKHGDQGRSW